MADLFYPPFGIGLQNCGYSGHCDTFTSLIPMTGSVLFMLHWSLFCIVDGSKAGNLFAMVCFIRVQLEA